MKITPERVGCVICALPPLIVAWIAADYYISVVRPKEAYWDGVRKRDECVKRGELVEALCTPIPWWKVDTSTAATPFGFGRHCVPKSRILAQQFVIWRLIIVFTEKRMVRIRENSCLQ